MSEYDVIVVGAGNAAFCAALAAQEQGAKVLMLEAAPEDESGGNSRFTAGSIRVVYNGVEDIKTLVPDLTQAEIDTTDFGTYTADKFFDDMALVTQHRADPDLVELLVTKSFDTLNWMREKGVRFIPIYGRQAFKIDGKFKFWGGLTVEAVGGGPGLVNMLTESAQEARHRDPLPHARDSISSSTATASRACACATTARMQRAARQGGGARLRRLRGQSGMAHALSRPRLGPRQGARLALQHRRRHPHGARHRREPVRQLVGLPRGAMGDERARVRRPRGRRPVPEALLSVRHPGQRHRQALRRRGRRLPQLHLCEIRPRGAGAARPVRLADLRPEGEAPAARRIPHPPDHQGRPATRSRNWRRSSTA